jgi:predicted RNA-binding Zn ribbon-like protein
MSTERLELLREFVNTLDVETGTDALATQATLVGWLAERGLVGDSDRRASAADVRRTAELREALRAHLLANDGAPLPEDAVAVLDRQARRSRVAVGFAGAGAELRPESAGVDGALGGLLAAVAGAMADGSWERLKACRADDCRWAFIDRSRNGSRHWCAMGVCGNRQKARTYRARHTR